MVVIRASNLKTYFECPRRWLLETIASVPQQSESVVIGKETHALIERYLFNFYQMSHTRDKMEKVKKELLAIFKSNVNRHFAQASIKSATNYAIFAEKVLKSFEAAHNEWHGLNEIARFDMEQRLSIKLSDNICLSGAFDLMFVKENGDVLVYDIKTMASRQDLMAFIIQLSAYALLVERCLKLDVKELGTIKIVKAKRLYCELQSTQDAEFIKFCKTSVESLCKFLATTLNEYLATKNEYLFKPSRHWSCNYCNYLPQCTLKKGE